jgi:hypothetical protein
MKLRLDLLEHLTEQDLLEGIVANNHRYMPEPRFSGTGVGSLSPTSTEERATEAKRGMELIRRLEQRAQQNGSASGPAS